MSSRLSKTSVSNFAHKAMQLSQMEGHDLRLGEGISESETSQYQESLSTMIWTHAFFNRPFSTSKVLA
ncbi:MAG: hypothetical protein P1U74_09300 [Legionellaceae bacterium]|nr:hypothetical protein [Legionellaceae bacterium]